jgi:hypothetical protein
VLRVGKRDHPAFTRLADQQDSARTEDHHARAVYFSGKNRDVESRRRFQLREIETGVRGASKIGEGEKYQYKGNERE